MVEVPREHLCGYVVLNAMRCHSKGSLAPCISYPKFTLLLKPCVVF